VGEPGAVGHPHVGQLGPSGSGMAAEPLVQVGKRDVGDVAELHECGLSGLSWATDMPPGWLVPLLPVRVRQDTNGDRNPSRRVTGP
jgi:hypothetical protein